MDYNDKGCKVSLGYGSYRIMVDVTEQIKDEDF